MSQPPEPPEPFHPAMIFRQSDPEPPGGYSIGETDPRLKAPPDAPKHEATEAYRLPDRPQGIRQPTPQRAPDVEGDAHRRRLFDTGEQVPVWDTPPRGRGRSDPGDHAQALRNSPPVQIAVSAESWLTKLARVMAILRDAILVGVFVLAVVMIVRGQGSPLPDKVPAFGPALGENPDASPTPWEPTYPCEQPTTDKWGTYCPETPGG